MELIAQQVKEYVAEASWIRRMFEAGLELKKRHGADQVCDFSLGNPDLPPPSGVAGGLRRLAEQVNAPLALGYMPNAGYPSVRQRLAAHLAAEQACALTAEHVVVTCGAAGGINAFLRAVLDPGDELVAPAPYFVEYGFYAANFGGVFKAAKSDAEGFGLDVGAVEAAMGRRTRVVLVNSPNNPTGAVYSREELLALAKVLERHSQKQGRPIYLLSDEPYRFLAYDGVEVPALLPIYPYSVVVGSFSKSLSLAGERVGYLAANPAMEGVDKLIGAVILANRILGYVNAPAVGQRLLEEALGQQVEVAIYARRRQAMAEVLEAAGIDFALPRGAFYFFPRVPGGREDTTFCQMLQEQLILAVPGRGFGSPGFFRLAFCLDESIIRRSGPGFRRAAEAARGGG